MPRAAILLAVITALGVAACGGEDEVATCRNGGGVWECRDDVAQTGCRCAAKTSDGGHPCTDSGQCDGFCVHTAGGCEIDATGMCQSHDERYACVEELILERRDPDPSVPAIVTCHSTC